MEVDVCLTLHHFSLRVHHQTRRSLAHGGAGVAIGEDFNDHAAAGDAAATELGAAGGGSRVVDFIVHGVQLTVIVGDPDAVEVAENALVVANGGVAVFRGAEVHDEAAHSVVCYVTGDYTGGLLNHPGDLLGGCFESDLADEGTVGNPCAVDCAVRRPVLWGGELVLRERNVVADTF